MSYRTIAGNAALIAAGNITSRLLGVAREILKSHFFGAGPAVDAINVALRIPLLLHDLLVGGMIANLFIPVFSDYKDRAELWRLASVVFNVITLLITLLVILMEIFAPQVVALFSGGMAHDVQQLTTALLRWTLPALIFLSAGGVLSGLLYALQRFIYPALTATVLNALIVLSVPLFAPTMGVGALAVGLLAGSILGLWIQLPGFCYQPLFFHPELRRMMRLYLPVFLGLLLDILVSKPATYHLASLTGAGGISWMDYATTLWQFPQGAISVAVSFAIFPTLAVGRTLHRGLIFILALIVPTALIMFVFAQPIVVLVLQHGNFTAFDTLMTAFALRLYLIGLPFNAVDLLLVFAFYSRKNMLTPALIGVFTTLIYLGLAFALVPSIGLPGIMLADSTRIALHALLCAWFLVRQH